MSDLYNALPAGFGGFDPSGLIGGSGNAGYYQKPMNLPWYQGRSILATTPEYLRNPLLMEKDLMINIEEGRPEFMRTLMHYAEQNGAVDVNDVRFRLPVNIVPNQRFYLKVGQTATTDANGFCTLQLDGNKTAIKTANPNGNIKQKGDIARLEVGAYILLMFSWVEPRRTAVVDSRDAGFYQIYGAAPYKAAPIPEVCKIVSINYSAGTLAVERMWAGEQRTTTPTYSGHIRDLVTVANSATPNGTTQVRVKNAYFLKMAKSMREDEIESKISNFSGTWTNGMLQRHLKAWGTQHLVEVISRNLGIESPGAKTKRLAIQEYYKDWEWTAVFGEKGENWDDQTGFWAGTTDGILANIPKSHFTTLKGIKWSTVNQSFPTPGTGSDFGSFHPQIFNKILENKGYIGAQNKILLCGATFHSNFSSMINIMTQAVPDVKSEWNVEGKRFKSSNNVTIDVIPSDNMSLNGLGNHGILMDPAAFRMVKLKGYMTDIYEVANENPLLSNGFIHGMQGFIDLNPDAHWVFQVAEEKVDGIANSADEYANIDPLGVTLE